MKLILLVVVCLGAVWAKPLDKEAVKAAARQLVLSCKADVGASDADVEAVKMKKMPETHEGLCMLACVFEKTDIMSDGKYSKSGMVTAFRPMLGGDATKIKNLDMLAETCEKAIGAGDSDKCKTAKMMVECIVKNGESHGFELPMEH